MFFSIIMPAYNAEKFIKKGIESVLSQTFDNWELVIVDDGSKDSTYSIISKYAEKDNRIVSLKQDNAGPGEARNTAIRYAQGDYLAFLDADDYLDNLFLEKMFCEIQTNKRDVVYYDTYYENEFGKISGHSSLSKFSTLSKESLIKKQMTGTLPWGFVKVIKRELVVNNKLYFSKLKVGEEATFSFDVLNRASSVGFVPGPLYHYVQYGAGQHMQGGLDPWFEVVKSMEKHLTEIGEIKKYRGVINSFASRALMINVYRITKNGDSFFKNRFKYIEAKKRYRHEFSMSPIDKKSMDKMSLICSYLMRINFFFPIYVAAKLRK